MQTKSSKSASYLAARSMLPKELQPLLHPMIEEYQFAAFKHHGQKVVSRKVIAELMLLGWRPGNTVLYI